MGVWLLPLFLCVNIFTHVLLRACSSTLTLFKQLYHHFLRGPLLCSLKFYLSYKFQHFNLKIDVLGRCNIFHNLVNNCFERKLGFQCWQKNYCNYNFLLALIEQPNILHSSWVISFLLLIHHTDGNMFSFKLKGSTSLQTVCLASSFHMTVDRFSFLFTCLSRNRTIPCSRRRKMCLTGLHLPMVIPDFSFVRLFAWIWLQLNLTWMI